MPEAAPLNVLVIGASGVFGSRLAERLALEPGIAMTLAGRRIDPLSALARRIGGGAVRALDRETVSGRDLAGYDLVIDAAGPFQGSGSAVVNACLDAGIDYLDLADGREWVGTFREQFDELARNAGLSLITGASSIPALSHAVVDRLIDGWQAVDTIHVGIFPGNRAPRGLSVVEAILSYAGHRVRVWQEGQWQHRCGWGDLHRQSAGKAGMRWASICDTPEQDLLVERYKPRLEASFHAGMELTFLHVGLWLLSLPVRWGVLRSLRPFAKPLLVIARWLIPFGSDRGAMTVAVSGLDAAGKAVEAAWLLTAEGNRGPFVPILPALIMIRRRRLIGREHAGAYPCSGILSLDDFRADFSALSIETTCSR